MGIFFLGEKVCLLVRFLGFIAELVEIVKLFLYVVVNRIERIVQVSMKSGMSS